jgi:GH35 family endo-1,4-beta-xylanase
MKKGKPTKVIVKHPKSKPVSRGRTEKKMKLKNIQRNPEEFYEWEDADEFEKFDRR